MGRAFSPCVLNRAASGRGYAVISGTIGVASCDGNDDGPDRCSGSERIWGVIGVSERRSRSVRVAVRCPPRARTCLESCRPQTSITEPFHESCFPTSSARPHSSMSKEQLAEIMFA